MDCPVYGAFTYHSSEEKLLITKPTAHQALTMVEILIRVLGTERTIRFNGGENADGRALNEPAQVQKMQKLGKAITNP